MDKFYLDFQKINQHENTSKKIRQICRQLTASLKYGKEKTNDQIRQSAKNLE